MHERSIGSLTVSALGLGCMNMSFGYGPVDDTVSTRLLNQALDTGYTFLDTAMVYGRGHNESLIGKAISGRRKEFVLATKCGMSRDGIDGRPELIAGCCDDSLKRLDTDVIDLYYLHRVDPKVPIEDTVGEMAKLVDQGKVRELGLSEVCVENLKRAHKVHPIAALQSEYSLWSRTPERGILEACAELGIAFVPFSPLGRAFLTGKATDVTLMTKDDLRQTIARPRFEPDAFAENQKLLGPFGEIAEANNCTMAQLALAWLLHGQDGKMIPIPGTKHIEYMEENAASVDVELDQATLDAVDQLINESTVTGDRYNAKRMADADSERD